MLSSPFKFLLDYHLHCSLGYSAKDSFSMIFSNKASVSDRTVDFSLSEKQNSWQSQDEHTKILTHTKLSTGEGVRWLVYTRIPIFSQGHQIKQDEAQIPGLSLLQSKAPENRGKFWQQNAGRQICLSSYTSLLQLPKRPNGKGLHSQC